MPVARSRIALARLRTQRIHGPAFPDAASAVRSMLAMQAQDLPGAKWSVGLRTTHATVADVDRALNEGRIVRAWPLRGTLHLVAPEDLAWMLGLTAERMLSGARTRYTQLGLDEETLARARRVAVRALRNGSLSRSELLAAFDGAGIESRGRGSHLIGYLAITGVLCLGPVDQRNEPGTEAGDATATTTGQRIVLTEQWIRAPRSLDRDEALGELLRRYVEGHAPATLADFVHWTKLPLRDARRAREIAGDAVLEATVEDTSWLCTPEAMTALDNAAPHSATPPSGPSVDLLPGFDEYLLGYRDRSAALPARHSDRIVPGGNGMFLPTVVRDGRVVGTWKRFVSAKGVRVEPAIFDGERAPSKTALQAAARRYAGYLGRSLDLTA